jgi:hypothetical protein
MSRRPLEPEETPHSDWGRLILLSVLLLVLFAGFIQVIQAPSTDCLVDQLACPVTHLPR